MCFALQILRGFIQCNVWCKTGRTSSQCVCSFSEDLCPRFSLLSAVAEQAKIKSFLQFHQNKLIQLQSLGDSNKTAGILKS